MGAAPDGPRGVASDDLQQLLRWQWSGGTWALVASRAGDVELALLTCSAGEQVGRLRSGQPDLVAYVRATEPAGTDG